MKKSIFMLCIVLLVLTSYKKAPNTNTIDNLKTFAKAYGYVKYFHPSDEASKIDWNRFAAYGAKEIMTCNTQSEVIKKLNDLFKPIAPSIAFTETKQTYDLTAITPETLDNYESTYWQHKGVSLDMSNQNGIYNSVRVNRYKEIDKSSRFSNLSISIIPEEYKGKRIKYTAWVKRKDGSSGNGYLWMRVDKSDKTMGFFENMGSRPIKSSEWQQYEIIGDIDLMASRMIFGCMFEGKGALYLDDVHLYYEDGDSWIEIPLNNGDFEAEGIGERNDNSDWIGRGDGYTFSVSKTEKHEGAHSAMLTYKGIIERTKGESLFDHSPKFGELIEKEIGESVFCQIPLNLYHNDDSTYPIGDGLKALQTNLNKVSSDATQSSVRLGNVIIAYNVFQHFFPYINEVGVDLDKELETALERSITDATDVDHLITLQKFTAPLKDGHVWVSGVSLGQYAPPINWQWIENKLVITEVFNDNLDVKIGDVVSKIDNSTTQDYFKEVNSRISAGTEGWLNYRAQGSSMFGEKDTELLIEVNGKTMSLKRDKKYTNGVTEIEIQKNQYKLLDDGIYYLNLDTVDMDTITGLLPKLKESKGIICDLRGYPNSNHGLISHLLKEKDTSTAWMRIPKIIYPDQEHIVGYENHGWEMEAATPYLGDQKVVFIIDGSAISYAESYMGFIKNYKLATIVGQPTAGANGNINPFSLLGNYRMSWTGMKVVKHDGSQHHAVGVLPDIYVDKTIEGVKSGKDEFLEKAIEVILK